MQVQTKCCTLKMPVVSSLMVASSTDNNSLVGHYISYLILIKLLWIKKYQPRTESLTQVSNEHFLFYLLLLAVTADL